MTAESAESLEANLDDDVGLVEATVLKLLYESIDVGDRVSCRTLSSEGAVSPPLRSGGLGNLVFCRDLEVELYVVERTRVVGCGDFVLAVEDLAILFSAGTLKSNVTLKNEPELLVVVISYLPWKIT